MSAVLKEKIINKKARIAVMGLGYVGLPLAVNFAKKGFEVIGLDKDVDRVTRIRKCENYILDIKDRDLRAVVTKGALKALTDFSVLKEMDAVIVCVPTPLKRKYTPDVSYILEAVKTMARYIKKNTLVVLESTTYPGTTREMIAPLLSKAGFRIGTDVFLSFSPERIDPGNKNYDVTTIPKVVGGMTPRCGELTALLYRKIIKNIHLVSSTEAAEMTKLLENTFRIINIGWINELARMCHHLGLDIWEIIEAAKTKPFGFMPFYPGLGVGGHCIPDDPLYLYWKAKQYGFSSKYIKLSADTNSSMPAYAVERLKAMLKEHARKSLREASLLVVGVTYKKDVKDLRKSPPVKLIELLKAGRGSVDYYDPIIPYLFMGGIDQKSIRLTREALRRYDCVVIATDHTSVDYKLILSASRLVFDIKNVYQNLKNKKIIKL